MDTLWSYAEVYYCFCMILLMGTMCVKDQGLTQLKDAVILNDDPMLPR